MDPHRALLRPPKLPPRAPWWSLLWASINGTLSRIIDRRFRHRFGLLRDPEAWPRRFPASFSDDEIDVHLPQSLRSRGYLGEPVRITRPGFTVGATSSDARRFREALAMTPRLHAAALFLLALCSCHRAPCVVSTPSASPDPVAACSSACSRMRALDCPSANPTDRGATCEEVCVTVQRGGIVTGNLDCRARAATCAAIDACERCP